MGGSQLNAIELAAGVRDLGHDVAVFGVPGTLTRRVQELGLEFLESPVPGRRPSRRVAHVLRSLVSERGIDVVHGYEWPPALEARIACAGGGGVPVATVMSMAVAPFIPARMPLVVGTEQIAATERRRRSDVTVIEPPVDSVHNAPGAAGIDVDQFRYSHGLRPDDVHVVCVSRLSQQLKLEGLLTAMEAVPRLGTRVVLVVVGGGPAEAVVRAAAREANARAGRRAVVLTGEVADPRPAYAVADVVLGMGGSALRGLAFAKPLVVQGEEGFWQTLTPESLAMFEWGGWYGLGAGSATGADRLRSQLAPLLASEQLRSTLGQFGRALLLRRFSLEAAAVRQLEVYQRALDVDTDGRWAPAADDARAVALLTGYTAARLVGRSLGRAASEDFNSRKTIARRWAFRQGEADA
jgi:hypothetical protein